LKKLVAALIVCLSASFGFADSQTNRLHLTLPTIGSPTWGQKVNSNFQILDSTVGALGASNTFSSTQTFNAYVQFNSTVNWQNLQAGTGQCLGVDTSSNTVLVTCGGGGGSGGGAGVIAGTGSLYDIPYVSVASSNTLAMSSNLKVFPSSVTVPASLGLNVTYGATVSTITISTVTANQIPYAGGVGSGLIGSRYFTFFSSNGVGALGTENLMHGGFSPYYVQYSSNAMGMGWYDASEIYTNAHMWGSLIMHPNAYPSIAQGSLNLYARDGSNVQIDVTGQNGYNSGTIQLRSSDENNEGTPHVGLQYDSTMTVLVTDLPNNVDAISGYGRYVPHDYSAVLEASSTTRGFLPPRLTTTQKNAIASPAAGLMVYDTTLSTMTFYNGSGWIVFGGGGGGSGSPGGSTGQMQYNNAGSFAGVSGSFVTASSTTLSTVTIRGSLGINAQSPAEAFKIVQLPDGTGGSTAASSFIVYPSTDANGTVFEIYNAKQQRSMYLDSTNGQVDVTWGISAGSGTYATSLTVAGQNVCQANGTNCPASSGGSSALQVTESGVQITSPTASINFYGGDFNLSAIGSTSTVYMSPDTTNYIHNTSSLQSGATMYVSSGTVATQFNSLGHSFFGGASAADADVEFFNDANVIFNVQRTINGSVTMRSVADTTAWQFDPQNERVYQQVPLEIRNGKQLKMYDDSGNYYTAIRSTPTGTFNQTYYLPVTTGTVNQFLKIASVESDHVSLGWATGSGGGISLTDLSASQPIVYNNLTGAFSATPISLSTGAVGTLQAAQMPALTGDLTTSGGSLATTLASVVTANQYGSATVVPVITFDAKGRITAVSSATITGGSGDAVLSATQTFSGANTFSSTVNISSVATVTALVLGTTNYAAYGSSGTITPDATMGNNISITLTSSATINVPINAQDFEMFRYRIIQDAAGSRAVTLGSGFAFGTDVSSATFSTAANKIDYLACIYNTASSKCHVVSPAIRGY